MTIRVLVLEDDADMAALVRDMLLPRGFSCHIARAGEPIARTVDEVDAEVVLTDLRMPGVDGLTVCAQLRDARPDIPVVVMTAFGSVEAAVSALRAGAYDFVTKPVADDVLEATLRRAADHHRLAHELLRLRRDAIAPATDLLGDSPAMQRVRELLGQIASLDMTVLVTGESGTGKELAARALHQSSPRGTRGRFVALNCAAVPESLLEAQLFGHVRGAFTDARTDRHGLLVEAHGGTLLLDEIGEMPLSLQPKLLRAMQERVVTPVGSSREVPFDARVVVATHRDLEARVAEGAFREDLYYRINVLHVELPPLRARGSDVLLLALARLRATAARVGKPVRGLSEGAAASLTSYAWPGNVRELFNAIDRAVALTRYEEVVVDDLPERVRAPRSALAVVSAPSDGGFLPLEEMERRHILAVYESVARNRGRAAAVLGVDRKTLYRKLLEYGER